MTDDGIIAELRQALATAQADAVEATARADRYARALTALECDAVREPDKSGGLQAVRESGPAPAPAPLNGATARTPTRMDQRVDCDVCGEQIARRQLTNHKRWKHPRPANPVTKSETEPPPPVPRPVTPSEWLGRVDSDAADDTHADEIADAATDHGQTDSHPAKCDCIRCHVARQQRKRAERLAASDAAEAARITWGVDGESPPKPTVRLNVDPGPDEP